MTLARDKESNGTIQGFAPSIFLNSVAGSSTTFNVEPGTIWAATADVVFDYGGGEQNPVPANMILVIPKGVTSLVVSGDAKLLFAGSASV